MAAARLSSGSSNARQLAPVAPLDLACAPKRRQKVSPAPGRGRDLYERNVNRPLRPERGRPSRLENVCVWGGGGGGRVDGRVWCGGGNVIVGVEDAWLWHIFAV